ncbi:MAG: XTP/dITP diphosphatase [Candidatus Dadabacteria bacterium]|nr:XTP/dITP diphosphatase [Candidatus Dadabacteria bacterium]NIX16379.1 XTP/dITP diphosphatase [Candidatus Dadabacteria bacterium]
MEELVIATTNKGKVKEFKSLLSPQINNILSINDFDNIPEIDETGSSFEENALIKARTVASITGKITISDDSGLEVEALSGEPGIYSARYAGDAASDSENIEKLLEELFRINDRAARFVCCIALVDNKGNEHTFTGTCEGEILTSTRGEGGFGYDPVFYYPDAGKTFAELSLDEKNKYSHRAKAINKLNEYLSTLKKS